MQQKSKQVDNYEYKENQVLVQDGIQIYQAKNIVLKQMFTVKKLNNKESTNKHKYQLLTNQVGVIRAFKHPNIIQCHKMLSTTNNYYLVYDHCAGQTLQSLIRNKQITNEEKIKVMKQIVSILQALKRKNVVHSNINPLYIYVNPKYQIKLDYFLYAHALGEQKEMNIKYKAKYNEYQPPQIQIRNMIYDNSDIYSLGCILQEMKIYQAGMGSSKEQVEQLIEKCKSEDHQNRPTIQQINSFLFNSEKTTSKVSKLNKYQMNSVRRDKSNSISKTRSEDNRNQKVLSKKGSEVSLFSESSPNHFKILIQLILKRRNLGLFLVEVAAVCFKGPQFPQNLNIVLGYLFLKKSVSVYENLHGFLKGDQDCEDEIKVTLTDKERKVYEKKQDYFKVMSTISNQCKSQKRCLDETKKAIDKELTLWFKEQANKQTIEDSTLKRYVLEYLTWILENSDAFEPDNKKYILQKLCLMSWLIAYGSIEKMFQDLIDEEKIILEDQKLYTHIDRLSEKDCLRQISQRVQKA